MSLLYLNKAHYPVTTLGPGRRIGLWLQGCELACPGCVSRDTWAFEPDQALPLPLPLPLQLPLPLPLQLPVLLALVSGGGIRGFGWRHPFRR